MAGNFEVLFARMALTLGVAKRDDLQAALTQHGKAPLPRYLVEKGIMAAGDAAKVSAEVERYLARKKTDPAAVTVTPPPKPAPAKAAPQDEERARQWALFDRATKDPLEKLVGRQLGQATLEKLLETGDVATVFAGRFGDDDRPCQVKVLRPDRVRDKVALERFTREAQTLAKIDHPNIGRVLEAGVAEKLKIMVAGQSAPVRYMVIEASAGKTLQALLAATGPLSPERAVKIGRATALGLAAAHRAKIVHRDLRPSNILVADDGGVRLVGFGLAKDTAVAGRLTATGQITGHPIYMAPEVARRGDVDGRADVYSLGCVLYAALAGRPPFQSQSVVKLVGLHLNGVVTPLAELAPHVATRLRTLVHRLLSKTPEERPDADELVRLLGAKDLLDGGSEPPKPVKPDSEEELRRALAVEESSGIEDAPGQPCAACELPLEKPAGMVHGNELCERCLESVESLDLCAACFGEISDKERAGASVTFAGHLYCAGCTQIVKLPCGACSVDVSLADLLAARARAKDDKLFHMTCPRKK
jgi:hypothetical protein